MQKGFRFIAFRVPTKYLYELHERNTKYFTHVRLSFRIDTVFGKVFF